MRLLVGCLLLLIDLVSSEQLHDCFVGMSVDGFVTLSQTEQNLPTSPLLTQGISAA